MAGGGRGGVGGAGAAVGGDRHGRDVVEEGAKMNRGAGEGWEVSGGGIGTAGKLPIES